MNTANYPRVMLALPNGVIRKMYVMRCGLIGWNVHAPSGTYSLKGTRDGDNWIPSEKAKPIYEEWAQEYLRRKFLPKADAEYYVDNVTMPNGEIKRCRIYVKTKHSLHKPLSGQVAYTYKRKRKNIQGKIIDGKFIPNFQFLYDEWLKTRCSKSSVDSLA